MNELFFFNSTQRPPITPAPRAYNGNMCGVRVPGLLPVPGGAADPTLVLSWFYDRYGPLDRQYIRDIWKNKGDKDVLVSWPDSQAFVQTPQQFVGTCGELVDNGFLPTVFLSAKPTSSDGIMSPEETLANIMLVLPLLIKANVIARACIGWELSLWLTPTDVQMLIDAISPMTMPKAIKTYVHFQEGYFSYQQDGHVGADFWNLNKGRLTGIFHQRNLNDLPDDKPNYQARIVDCLQRFDGQFGYNRNDGLWDFIAMEITAQLQFNGQMSESDGDAWGQVALTTPPIGDQSVRGSGNGE